MTISSDPFAMCNKPTLNNHGITRRTLFSIAVTASLAAILAGCANAIEIQTQLYIGAKKADREKLFAGYVSQFANDDGAWYDLVGENWIFLSDEDRKYAVKDQESFLKTALGAYFDQKGYRYEDLPEQLREEVPRSSFNYYKGYGRNWLQERVNAPQNHGLKERIKLFQARMGRTAQFPKPSLFAALIKNDNDFKKFLTDNRYATLWVANSIDNDRSDTSNDYPDSRLLGPIVTGILPALGS